MFWIEVLKDGLCCFLHLSVAKIQSMKTAVPKNDKKRRKQLTEEISRLEAELNLKHENELRELHTSSAEGKVGCSSSVVLTVSSVLML